MFSLVGLLRVSQYNRPSLLLGPLASFLAFVRCCAGLRWSSAGGARGSGEGSFSAAAAVGSIACWLCAGWSVMGAREGIVSRAGDLCT
jgi:hypothetical protein